MGHIEHNGRLVEQGETFEPVFGYKLTYVGRHGLRHVFRDGEGEFSRFGTITEPRPSRPVMLGERRTVVEEVPDARPIVGETIYIVTHQMSVPGGWQDIEKGNCRAREMQAGVYSSTAGIEDGALRNVAEKLWIKANEVVDAHPYTKLGAVLLDVRLQEGTGAVGGWDDPGKGFEIAGLLEEAHAL
ncbi:hypothetical protein ABZX93_06035 [Streptomyces sp. NPDC006632]|uniref:hypothetical protein n=1 Tax=Streptomyces sp. NPDC006632 TaxID=3157182 RepID=UPI0033B5F6EC